MRWILGLLLCTAWAVAAEAEPERIIFVQVPAQNAAAPEASGHDAALADGPPFGSRIVLYDHGSLDGSVKVLTPEFAAAGKPDVSFDGKRILFIARRGRNDPSQIWGMDADGGSVRRVTDESGGFSAAIYLSTMYTLDAEGPVYQIGFCRTGAYDSVGNSLEATEGPRAAVSSAPTGADLGVVSADHGFRSAPPVATTQRPYRGCTGYAPKAPQTQCGGESALVGSLFTCRMDGTRIRQITFDPNGVSDPFLLSDGRLLYTRWRRTSNGTGSASDRARPPSIPPWEEGRPADPASRSTDLLTVYPDGMDVFVFAAADEPPAIRSMPCETPDGLVVYVESPVGSTDRDSADRGGALVAVSRARSLHTRRVLVDDPNGLYHSPSAMNDGRLLVSYRPKSGGSYGVYVFDPASGTRVARVFDDPQWHEVDALVLGPRRVPAGRSSAIREGVGYGFLYCMDAYLSDRPEVGAIERGQIKRLRVLKFGTNREADAQEPSPRGQTNSGAGIGVEQILGEVPLESDGSFSVQVPAQVPLRLQTLDGAGHVLQDMKSWIWVMPKEARGCIGCHEDRELTPPNRQTQALRNPPHPVGIEDPVNSGHAAEVLDQRRPGE